MTCPSLRLGKMHYVFLRGVYCFPVIPHFCPRTGWCDLYIQPRKKSTCKLLHCQEIDGLGPVAMGLGLSPCGL